MSFCTNISFFLQKKWRFPAADCGRLCDSAIALRERNIMCELVLQKEWSDSVQKSLQGTHLSVGDRQYQVKMDPFQCIRLLWRLDQRFSFGNHEIVENGRDVWWLVPIRFMQTGTYLISTQRVLFIYEIIFDMFSARFVSSRRNGERDNWFC